MLSHLNEQYNSIYNCMCDYDRPEESAADADHAVAEEIEKKVAEQKDEQQQQNTEKAETSMSVICTASTSYTCPRTVLAFEIVLCC